MKSLTLPAIAAALALSLPCAAAYKKGDTAYTKRMETPLLAEPKPLAGHAAKIDFAQPLKIEEVSGSWLRVSSKKPEATGWVYAGNVAENKPVLPPATGMTADTASRTTVSAAARPLTKNATDYAQSRNLNSTGDNKWLEDLSATLTDEDVTRYLVDNKKGEYRQ